jgi:putative ABC transport system substrate-binding protein
LLLVAAIVGAAVGWPADARAGEVVIVLSSSAQPYEVAAGALKDQLTRQGRRSRTVLLADMGKDGGSAHAVVALGTPAALAMHKQLPPQTLLVYAMVASPESAGLTRGRTATGVSTDVPFEEQFNLIASALPAARSVGVLYHGKVGASREMASAAAASIPRGWRVEMVAVDQYRSVAEAIDDLLSRKIDIVWTAPDAAVFNSNTVRALLLGALRKGKPVFGFSPAFVQAGALVGVGIDPADQGRQAAALVAKVLAQKDAAGGVTPPEHQVAVNLIVARELRIELPRELVQRAAYVFRPAEGGAP